MIASRARAIGLFAATLVAFARPAGARADDAATAQTLFEEGKKLLAAKRFAEACPKFETSQKLDPAGGTLLYAAVCHEEIGKLATAWAELNEAISLARRDKRKDREDAARTHLDAITPRLTRLTIRVPPSVAALAGVEVRRDGVPVERSTWGVAVPVDPGQCEISASAAGRAPWRTTVDIVGPGGAPSVDVPDLKLASAPPPPETSPRPRRVAGFVVGGLGVVGLGVGIGTGIMALGKASTIKDPAHCDASLACDQAGVDAARAGKTLSVLSPVTLAIGAAGVGVGIFLVVSGAGATPPATALRATPLPGGGGLGLAHRF